MKAVFAGLFAAALLFASHPSAAQRMNSDDVKWINQCLDDNKNEGAREDVVRKYCVCMNEKMDSNETRSISTWEKANPRARDACSREAGWR